jgi:hypothetical protein
LLNQAKLLDRVGDRFEPVGEDQSVGAGDVDPHIAQRRPSARRARNCLLPEQFSLVPVEHEQVRTIHHGHHIRVRGRAETWVAAAPHLGGPEGLPRFGIDRLQDRLIGLHKERSPVQHQVGDAAPAEIDVGLVEPEPGQAVPRGGRFGNDLRTGRGVRVAGRHPGNRNGKKSVPEDSPHQIGLIARA